MKKLLFLLLLSPFFLSAQTPIKPDGDTIMVVKDGDTIRVGKKTGTASTTVNRVIGVKDSTITFTVKVPVFGDVTIPFTYQYDAVTITPKVTPPVTEPPVVDPPTGSATYQVKVTQRTDQWTTGVADWHGHKTVAGVPMDDYYYRFNWNHFEKIKGTYTFTLLDKLIDAAIKSNQTFSFGIMTIYVGGRGQDGVINYDGAYSSYPQYLHAEMQAEKVKDYKKTFDGGTYWLPNENSEVYLTRLLELHKAIAKHIDEKGYRDVISSVDIRGHGNFGEWHGWPYITDVDKDYPTGTKPTESTYKRIIDAHVQGFPDLPLVVLFNAYDGDQLANTRVPLSITRYLLAAKNNWGLIGFRRDNYGAQDYYIQGYTNLNPDKASRDLIMERYKYAPITGEPSACCTESGSCATCQMWDLETQIRRYHVSSIGNGNMSPGSNQTFIANYKKGAFAAGHRVTVTGGTITAGPGVIKIALTWSNPGVAPTYTRWYVVYQLRQGSTVVKEFSSVTSPKLKLGTWSSTDTYAGVPSGTYELRMIVKNDKLKLNIGLAGKQSDGTYILATGIKL